jgi:hypothetical protein
MDMMAAGVGLIMNLFFVGLIVAAVMKLFNIHTTLVEIKDQLAKAPSVQPASIPTTPARPAFSLPTRAQQPSAQPASPQPTLRVPPPSAPAPAVAPMVGDTRSGEEMLRELDAQMRIEEQATRHPAPRV